MIQEIDESTKWSTENFWQFIRRLEPLNLLAEDWLLEATELLLLNSPLERWQFKQRFQFLRERLAKDIELFSEGDSRRSLSRASFVITQGLAAYDSVSQDAGMILSFGGDLIGDIDRFSMFDGVGMPPAPELPQKTELIGLDMLNPLAVQGIISAFKEQGLGMAEIAEIQGISVAWIEAVIRLVLILG